jgi:hypothetical protein
MSDFFDIFASCCGERKPRKAPKEFNKVCKDKNKNKKEGAPFLDSPRARALDPDIEDFLQKCSGVFRSTLSPIASVGSSLESPRELSSSILLEFESESRASSPTPNPRNSLYGALETIGDLFSFSTPPNSPRKGSRDPRR